MKLKNMFLAFMLGCLSVYATSLTPTVYVGNTGTNTVSAISTATNAIIATITVGNAPAAIVTTPDGQYAYVGNAGDGTVSVITTATNTVKTTLSVGSSGGTSMIMGITPNGKTVYACNTQNNLVYPITVATNTVGSGISISNGNNQLPNSIAFTADSKITYVASANTTSDYSTVAQISTATNTVTTIFNNIGGNPAAPVIAVTSDNAVYLVQTAGDYYYLASGSSSFVQTQPNVNSDQISDVIAVGSTAYALDYSFAGGSTDSPAVYALKNGATVSTSAPIGPNEGEGYPFFSVSPNGKTIYVPVASTLSNPTFIYPVTASNLSVGSPISLGNVTLDSAVFTADSATAYALITSGSNSYVIPLTVSGSVVGNQIAVGKGANCIAIATPKTTTTGIDYGDYVRITHKAVPTYNP